MVWIQIRICWPCYGSKLFAKVTSRWQKSLLQAKNRMCVLLLSNKEIVKGEFQICPRMDLDNILYVEYLRYNNYKNEIILFLEN